MTVRIIVCGGRDFTDKVMLDYVLSYVHTHRSIAELIHGGARGADQMANRWAFNNGIPRTEVRADWRKHGRAAGPIRNREMLWKHLPDGVVAFPGGRGTADMVKVAAEVFGVPVLMAEELWRKRNDRT